MPQPIIIKKYENRRLYDTSESRYVNLDDISQMVREGAEIRVVDAATGEDLTRLVLTQIIVETAKAPESAFSLDMLRQMIMASGRLSQDGLRSYMEAMLDVYQKTYRAFTPAIPTPFDFARKPNEESPASQPATGPAADPTDDSARASHTDSVDSLRQRVEDLERLIARNASPRSTTKPKSASRSRRSPRTSSG